MVSVLYLPNFKIFVSSNYKRVFAIAGAYPPSHSVLIVVEQ